MYSLETYIPFIDFEKGFDFVQKKLVLIIDFSKCDLERINPTTLPQIPQYSIGRKIYIIRRPSMR